MGLQIQVFKIDLENLISFIIRLADLGPIKFTFGLENESWTETDFEIFHSMCNDWRIIIIEAGVSLLFLFYSRDFTRSR